MNIKHVYIQKQLPLVFCILIIDVPSGNAFITHDHICIYKDRVEIYANVEWVKSCWIKGIIERAVYEGIKKRWELIENEILRLSDNNVCINNEEALKNVVVISDETDTINDALILMLYDYEQVISFFVCIVIILLLVIFCSFFDGFR